MTETDNNKKSKQAEFLAPFIEDAEYTLQVGLKTLKYCNCLEADALEKEMIGHIQTLKNATGGTVSKEEIKSAIQGIEMLTDYATYLYCEALKNLTVVNQEFAPEGPSEAHVKYLAKFMKAFEAKQKRAPGFDSTGGMARRTGS